MVGLSQDIRYALRAIRRAPAFSAIAIACLAVGIGVNAAAFSVLDAFLVRDLPGVERQSELNAILVSRETEWGQNSPSHTSTLDWEMFRNNIPGFSSSGVIGTASVALRVGGQPLAVRADFLSGDFFAMLRTRPVLGRLLTADDDRPGAPPAVVISHHLWEREFGRRRDVLGSPLQVGNVAFTIVGVAPEGFVGIYFGELVADPEHGAPYLMLPVASAPLVRADSRYARSMDALSDGWLVLVGRRRPGVSAAEVQAQANVVTARIAAEYPLARRNMTAVAREPNTASTGEMLAGIGFVMAIPLLILLVSCANLANQLLARAVQRTREIGVRLSLGATRARLVRQLLIESSVLALLASLTGIAVARLLTSALGAFALVLPFEIPMDWRVVIFTTALAVVTAFAFGLVPALRATRLDLAQTVKEGANSGGYQRSRLRNGLVVVQVAASVALLALSGVFVRASQRTNPVETPDNVDRLLTVPVNLDLLGYSAATGQAFQARAMERLGALPGVEAVALAPFAAVQTPPSERVNIAGDAPDRERWYQVARVAGDWFSTRNLRPLEGRLFTPEEARIGAPLAVLNQAATSRLWPGGSAIGKSVRIGEDSSATVVTVVGVIPATRRPRNEDPAWLIITPAASAYHPRAHFYIRTSGSAAALRSSIRNALQELDPRLPLPAAPTLGESLQQDALGVAQIGSGVGAMGIIALLLAALGLSAVLSFVVEQRRYEIGVRMALGARTAMVTWLILRQSLVLTASGIALGASVGAATAILLRGILFGLPPIDPVSFAGSTAILLVVALLSSAAPARRAAGVDPAIAMRSQ